MTPPVAVAAAGSCPEGLKKMVSHRGCACMKPAMSRGVVAIRVRRTCSPGPALRSTAIERPEIGAGLRPARRLCRTRSYRPRVAQPPSMALGAWLSDWVTKASRSRAVEAELRGPFTPFLAERQPEIDALPRLAGAADKQSPTVVDLQGEAGISASRWSDAVVRARPGALPAIPHPASTPAPSW